MKEYVLRLDTGKYADFYYRTQNSQQVKETNLHHTHAFRTLEIALKYAHAINNNKAVISKRFYSDFKVVEITEVTRKVTKRILI